MSAPALRLARPDEQGRVLAFINEHFDWRLPVVNRPEWFRFYFQSGDALQFALAEQKGKLAAVAGYILASRGPGPDVWVSVWVARKGCNGAGLELMAALPGLLGARVVACNNIRPETVALYRFLGWHAGRVGHYYRLADRPAYHLAQVARKHILPVSGDLTLDTVRSVTRLEGLGMPFSPHTPAKDVWYMARRYFAFDYYRYQVWSASEGGRLLAYLVTRLADTCSGRADAPKALRIVDYIGPDEVLPRLGSAIDGLLARSGAEYADCYCAGVPADVLRAAGFCERAEDDANVIPTYLEPPLYQNIEYYYFTNQPEGFVLFKADGDQDRPNLPAL